MFVLAMVAVPFSTVLSNTLFQFGKRMPSGHCYGLWPKGRCHRSRRWPMITTLPIVPAMKNPGQIFYEYWCRRNCAQILFWVPVEIFSILFLGASRRLSSRYFYRILFLLQLPFYLLVNAGTPMLTHQAWIRPRYVIRCFHPAGYIPANRQEICFSSPYATGSLVPTYNRVSSHLCAPNGGFLFVHI